MYIHLLARHLRQRKCDRPNLGSLLLCALASIGAIEAHEVARAAPSVVTAKRPDDQEQPAVADGPETAELKPVFIEPAAEPMPPGRGMTYAMQQPDDPWRNHSWIRSSVATEHRNSVLLDLRPNHAVSIDTPPH